MKKRLMSLLLTAAMIVSMVVVPAAAADTLTMQIGTATTAEGSTTVMPGSDISVPVEITANPGTAGIYVEFHYDTDVLTCTSVTYPSTGSIYSSSVVNADETGTGVALVIASQAGNTTATGTYAILGFTVAADVDVASTEITMKILDNDEYNCFNESYEAVPYTFVDGTIAITYPATATTGEPEQKTVTSAILNGSYTALDGVTVSASGIKWGTAEDALTNTAAFGAEVTGSQGDTIYYQAYATVSGVDYVGEIKSIKLALPYADEVTISGADSITVTPDPNTTTYTAAVKDQFGNNFDTDVTWSMTESYEGVSIADGVVTVTKAAESGTATIKAVAGDASDTFEITIVRPAPVVSEITISADGSVAVPTAAVGTATVELSATAVDQFGKTITLTDVDWSISKADGVSIDGDVITVTNKAAAGTVTVTAKVGNVEDTFDLTITKAAPVATAIEISGPVSGDIMADQANTLTYSAVVTDQFGDKMDVTPAWDVNSRDVSIADGVLTIPAMTKSQSVKITAASGNATNSIDVVLTRLGAVADKIELSGTSEITLPDLEEESITANITAVVTDNWGDVMPAPEISWTVPTLSGVSIDDNGALTITTEAGEVDFTVSAECGDARAEFPVSVKKATSVATTIAFSADTATMTIPTDDNANAQPFTAIVTDQYGVEMTVDVSYSFAPVEDDQDTTGVTASGNVVTITKDAVADNSYILTATYGDLDPAQITITMVDIEMNWVYTASDATYGAKWSNIVKIDTKKSSATLNNENVPGTFSVDNASEIPDAGVATYTIRFVSTKVNETTGDPLYDVTTTGTVTITPAELKLTWSKTSSFTYNGELPAITATLKGALTGDDVTVTVKDLYQDASSYEATAELAGADAGNYTLTYTPKAYTIKPATPAMTVSAVDLCAGKDAEALLAVITANSAVAATGVKGEALEGTVSIVNPDAISGYSANSTKKIAITFTPANSNYAAVQTNIEVNFTEGNPQIIQKSDITTTYSNDNIIDSSAYINAGEGTTQALILSSSNEKVVSIVDGKLQINAAGNATITVVAPADAENEWAKTTVTYTVTVSPKAVTIKGATAADKAYDGTSDAVISSTEYEIPELINNDIVTVDASKAKATFASANVGSDIVVSFDGFSITGEDAANYTLSAQPANVTANITKADATVSADLSRQTPGKVEAVTVTLTPAAGDVTIKVEYQIPAVEEVACDHVGDKLCTDDGSACQHTDCGCSYVAPADAYWTEEVPQAENKAGYPVRVSVTGSSNINDIVEREVGVLIVKKASSGNGGSSIVTPPAVEPTPVPEQITFVDVDEDDWFHDYVIEAAEQGLFAGTDDDHFSPDMEMNRAMMVTVMAALEFGEDGAPKGTSDFTDLTANWYKNAVAWAAKEKVTAGISDTEFGPDLALTREQVAVFLYAYAQSKDIDVSSGEDTNILSYNDALDIAEWAIPAMQWACAEGLLEGTPDGDLLPKAVATRAQVAVILVNFSKLIND